MTALLIAVLVASLLGSMHCAGMCGGIVTLCVTVNGQRLQRDWGIHAAYNAGRLMTYVALGTVSGAVGAAVDLGGRTVGLSRLAVMLAGGTMVVVGIAMLLRTLGVRIGCARIPGLDRAAGHAIRAVSNRPPVTRGLLIGLLTGLLPCGWLYAFVITAAGTGSPWLGAATMAMFWLGTLPIMLGLGLGIQRLAGRFRRSIPTVTSLALVVVGVIAVLGRLDTPAFADVDSQEATGDLTAHVERVRTLNEEEPPCCRDDD